MLAYRNPSNEDSDSIFNYTLKLDAYLAEKEASNKAKQTNDAWREHSRIVRGNPVRVYKGMGFRVVG